MALSMSFDTVIRPYFTPCYRAHMDVLKVSGMDQFIADFVAWKADGFPQ